MTNLQFNAYGSGLISTFYLSDRPCYNKFSYNEKDPELSL